uniref:Uncharacterized protein n=1 Tax=Anopheles darlingi TaxID=43151 RepID=A0A2M4DBD9_ANODA
MFVGSVRRRSLYRASPSLHVWLRSIFAAHLIATVHAGSTTSSSPTRYDLMVHILLPFRFITLCPLVVFFHRESIAAPLSFLFS